MEVEGEKPSSSLPSNYVTIHQLKERWLLQQQQKQQSPSKPEPENPKTNPNTQTQRPNYGRVTKEHKHKDVVKVDDNGSTSKTLVVNEIKNPNQNYRPVTNQPKPKVDDNGSTSKTKTLVVVADDFKNLKIEPMADDNWLSTKTFVEKPVNETGETNFETKKKKKKKKNKKLRNPKVVTDENGSGAGLELGPKVVEGEMEKRSCPSDKNLEVEMVEEKGKEGRRYGRGNGNGSLRFGAEAERKVEPEREAEVVEEKQEKKSYGSRPPADKNPNGAELKPEMEEVVVEKGKWGRRYGLRNENSRVVWEKKEKTAPVDRNDSSGGGDDALGEEVVKERNVGQGRDENGGYGNGNSKFGAEPELKMEAGQEAEVVEEKREKKSYGRRKPADKNPNEAEIKPEREKEVVVEKGIEGRRYGHRKGNSKVVWEQKEKVAPVDGNDSGGGRGGVDDGFVEEVVKERNAGQGRDRNGGYGNWNSKFGAETVWKMEAGQEVEVAEEKREKRSYRHQKPAGKNPNGAEIKPEREEEVVAEKGREGRRYGHRNGNSKVVWEQKEKVAPVDGNDSAGGRGGVDDGFFEEVVKERNAGQGRDRNGDYGNGNSRFGAEPERKMELEYEVEVVEEKKSYRRRKPADKNPNEAEIKPGTEEEVVVEKGREGRGYGHRNGNSKVVWEQKEKTAPVDGNGGDGVVEEAVEERNVVQGRDISGGGDSVVEEFVKERNVGQGRHRNGGYGMHRNGGYGGMHRNGGYGMHRNGGYVIHRNGGYGRSQRRAPRDSDSFGEQKEQIWVKKGESVVPN